MRQCCISSLDPGGKDFVTLAVSRHGKYRESGRTGRRHIQSSKPAGLLREQGSPNVGRFFGVLVDPAAAHQLQWDRTAGNDLEVVFMSRGIEGWRPEGECPPEASNEPLIGPGGHVLAGKAVLSR